MDRMDHIDTVLDLTRESIQSIDVSLASINVILKEHSKSVSRLEKRVAHIEKHINMIQGAVKFVGLVAVFAAIAEGVVKVMEFYK